MAAVARIRAARSSTMCGMTSSWGRTTPSAARTARRAPMSRAGGCRRRGAARRRTARAPGPAARMPSASQRRRVSAACWLRAPGVSACGRISRTMLCGSADSRWCRPSGRDDDVVRRRGHGGEAADPLGDVAQPTERDQVADRRWSAGPAVFICASYVGSGGMSDDRGRGDRKRGAYANESERQDAARAAAGGAERGVRHGAAGPGRGGVRGR